MSAKIKSPGQVFRVDGRNVFMELMVTSLPIGKMLLNFMEYDPTAREGERCKNNISFYLDIFEAKVVADDILSGRYAVLANKSRQDAAKNNSKYPRAIKSFLAGTNAAEAGRGDKKPESRQLEISPGQSKPFIFTAKKGPGKELPGGLIAPDYGKPEGVVRVPFDVDTIKEFAEAINLLTTVWGITKFCPLISEQMQTLTAEAQAKIQEKVDLKTRDATTTAPASANTPSSTPTATPPEEKETVPSPDASGGETQTSIAGVAFDDVDDVDD